MGMHEPGWRERNEEQAWESWELEVRGHVAALRRVADKIERTVALTRDTAQDFMDALANADEATEKLFALRHGPENPDA